MTKRTHKGRVLVRLTFGMRITERFDAHVAEPNGAFAARVDEGVAVVRVKLCRRDHLGQLLHVLRLDVHDVERLANIVSNYGQPVHY